MLGSQIQRLVDVLLEIPVAGLTRVAHSSELLNSILNTVLCSRFAHVLSFDEAQYGTSGRRHSLVVTMGAQHLLGGRLEMDLAERAFEDMLA